MRGASVRHLSSCLCNLSCGINIAVALCNTQKIHQQYTTTIHQFHSARMQRAKLHCCTSTQCYMLLLIPCSTAAQSCTSYTSLRCILHHYWWTVCQAIHRILTIFKLNISTHVWNTMHKYMEHVSANPSLQCVNLGSSMNNWTFIHAVVWTL